MQLETPVLTSTLSAAQLKSLVFQRDMPHRSMLELGDFATFLPSQTHLGTAGAQGLNSEVA